MEFDPDSIQNGFGGQMEWLRSKEDFVEFIIMLANLRSGRSTFAGYPHDRFSFDLLCDAIGSEMLRVFRPDISPYGSFGDLRRGTTTSFAFTRQVRDEVMKARAELALYRMLSSRGITPGREIVNRINRDWKEAEDFASFLDPFLNIQ
jgi:hypothetical protein